MSQSQLPSLGIDLAAPPPDLPARLASLQTHGASFIVSPLAHPRYRHDKKRPLDGDPMTRSDLVLDSQQWGQRVVGKISPWLQLDSPHVAIRRRSEEAFRQEIAWAAHLGLPAVLLPPPGPEATNYARLLQWACLSTQHLKFLVRVPIAADEGGGGSGGGGGMAVEGAPAPQHSHGPWSSWDRLRTLCEQSASLGVALELGVDLPETDLEVQRWCGEPIKMLILPSTTFLSNKKGYPTLSRDHQATFLRLMEHNPQLVVSGREDGGRSKDDPEGIGAHLRYVEHLCTKIPAGDDKDVYESPYYDYLQAPLQPLADNLESSTYETFEQDPIKYKQYQAAVRQALTERHTADGPPAIVMVLGAGRGPLVAASLAAAAEAQRPVKVYALDKNENAVVTLQNRCRNDPLWAQFVTVVPGDMRSWAAPVTADIIVSELLGSWGDNELSPECLDGAMRYLKKGGISIPCSYYSTVAPLSSSKLWNEVRGLRELKHFETTYVVKVHNAYQMADAQKCFTFDHPGDGWKENGWSADVEPPDNSRTLELTFENLPTGGRLHGFVGYFHATLYKDIIISTDPPTESIGMFSWFPLFIPIRHPVLVPDGGTVTVQFWRHVSSHKVWYEWALLSPQASPIHNPNGRSAYIGL